MIKRAPNTCLNELAQHAGIITEFIGLDGSAHVTSVETKIALLRANDLAVDNDAMVRETLAELQQADAARLLPRDIIVSSGQASVVKFPNEVQWRLELEGDEYDALEGRAGEHIALPPLPSGVHSLLIQSGDHSNCSTLIAAPNTAPTLCEVSGLSKLWGINTSLYGLRSPRNAGIGDFADLATAAESLAQHGAGFIGINPVHALGWSDEETISPYSPSHRGFLNTAHIALDLIPGIKCSTETKAILKESARICASMRASQTIQYANVYKNLKRQLQLLFSQFKSKADQEALSAFKLFCMERGRPLQQFALFEALSEQHGADWNKWPDELQLSANPQHESQDKISFHQWLQWLANQQLQQAQESARGAGMSLGLYLDMAVGPRRGGAESWCNSGVIAPGVSIGAPPDHLSPAGQNWNLAAYAPAKLTQNRYQAFREILAASMRYSGVLRIDHVLGTNRSFWIPDNGSPGAYIQQPFQSMLAVIAIEAERAGTVVIGEDLGLVPGGFREAINARGFYSYSVMQYEKDNQGHFRQPSELRSQSLACFSTHDTPTLKGFQTCRDIEWWRKLNWIDEKGEQQSKHQRESEIRELATLGDSAPCLPNDSISFESLSRQVHGALAESPAAIVCVQLDDVFGETEAQNLPGTIDEHPNWRRRCSLAVEEFESDERLASAGEIMSGAERSPLATNTQESS